VYAQRYRHTPGAAVLQKMKEGGSGLQSDRRKEINNFKGLQVAEWLDFITVT
jgi:hypothetical protein